MTRPQYATLFFLFLTCLGCNTNPETTSPSKIFESQKNKVEKDDAFPLVRNISTFPKTKFLPTLETPLKKGNNGVYAASLLFAWDEIKKEVKSPISGIENKELQRINSSASHIGVLKKNEYLSSVEREGSMIRASAYFKKSLPFIVPLRKDRTPLLFLDEKVESFGFKGENKTSRILYYNNDNDFALKLIPKDSEHEIILMMSTFSDDLVLKNEVLRLDSLIRAFRKNRNQKNRWKHYFSHEDKVSIPMIEFNIETEFPDIVGSTFMANDSIFNILRMFQRTAFVLDETGAKVESEAMVEAMKEEADEEIPKPKKLFFNKPFLILLKRQNSQYPYFSMFVSNAELMRKK